MSSGVAAFPATIPSGTVIGRVAIGPGPAEALPVAALLFQYSPITNSLGADVLLSNTGLYFNGPSIAQGTLGTWYVSGAVTLIDTAGVASFQVKLWDGATVIASCTVGSSGSLNFVTASLSGFITSPTGNLQISVKDGTSTSGKMLFNQSGNSKDSTITAIRIV